MNNVSGAKPFVVLRVKTHRADMTVTKDQLVKEAAEGYGKRKDFGGIQSRDGILAPLLRAL